MSRRAPLLIALPAAFGLLHPTALAEPPHGTTPGPEPGPAATAGALEATLDELAVQVRRLSREAGADAGTEALRRELAAARGRIAELEAARAEDAATIAELRAELESSRAEARALGEPLEAAAGRSVAEGGNETGAGSSPAPRASPAAGDAAAGDGAPAGAPAYYVATNPVNLRAGPRDSAQVLAVVGEGELVRGIGRDGGWLRVHYTNRFATEFTGWVHGNFLRSVATPARRADRSGSEREP